MSPKVDAYREDKASSWQQPILVIHRECILACGLKEYADHISEPKKEATLLRRLEKWMQMLRERKGLRDKYKDC